MKSSKFLRICSASVFMFALQAHAANYELYTGSGTTCPDGSKFVFFVSAKFCKLYSATITWAIPTTRVDGSALPINQLKSYEIYWTRTSDNTTGTISVSSNTQTAAKFQTFQPSTYYFAMSAIDSNGIKSSLSPLAQIQF